MMILAGFLAAVSLVAPEVGDLESKVEEAFQADTAKQTGPAGAVITFDIGPSGQVLQCTTLEIIGNEKAAKGICDVVSSLTMQPASIDGQVAPARISSIIKVNLDDSEASETIGQTVMSPDIVLQVDELPRQMSALLVRITLAIGKDGKVIGCEPTVGTTYGVVACEQAATYAREPIGTQGGGTIAYVTQESVLFDTNELPDTEEAGATGPG